jgi:hypothetical protein
LKTLKEINPFQKFIIRTKWWTEERKLKIFIEAVKIIENQPINDAVKIFGIGVIAGGPENIICLCDDLMNE